MVSKDEIEEILSQYYLIRPPAKIVLLDKPLAAYQHHELIRLRGVTPAWMRDTIVLGTDATDETVLHETLHTMGLGELLTRPLAKILIRRYRRRKLLGQTKKRVKYRVVYGDEAKKLLEQMYIHIPEGASPVLLVLESS